jgi:hypothetical protein
MDRREWLAALGTGGAGLGLSGVACGADDHAEKPEGKYMAAAGGFHHHFCGIHAAKDDSRFQLVTQHYCILGQDVHQCLLFDACDAGSKLLGIEYIISDEAFRGLEDSEKKFWHPHTFEVLAGGLIAPGMTAADETKFMKALLPTWGKTWHTWPDPKSKFPLGEPRLMWSLGADDQVDAGIVAARDKQFGVETSKIRAARAKEFGLQVPKVPFPKNAKEIGRQWTGEGDDKPTKL